MAGTWSESNNKVTISQSADTFVRNLSFNVVANGSSPLGTFNFGGPTSEQEAARMV